MPLPGKLAALAEDVSNWGRFGDTDERGTLNHIDDAARRRGAAAVRRGVAFSLALPLDEDGPQIGAIPGRDNPAREMISVNRTFGAVAFSDDKVTMGLQAATHWDALAHVSYDGLLYNGFPADSVDETGATRCGIDKVGPLVTRGLLLDVARLRGVERLEGAVSVGAQDLAAAASAAGVSVEAGDVLLVRTGQMQLLLAGDREAYGHPSPGIGPNAVAWLHSHDVAAVAVDNMTFEVLPGADGSYDLPVHGLLLRDVGMLQGQNWNLEELAADCADDGVYEFLLEATPEPFTRACGAPVSPVALK